MRLCAHIMAQFVLFGMVQYVWCWAFLCQFVFMMKCTILGCGGSRGVPEVACSCCVCHSADVRDVRMRSSIFLESDKTKILVDTSPDLHQQLIINNIRDIDYVLYTHAHFDHVAGVDDVKPILKLHGKKMIPAWMHGFTHDAILRRLNYAFDDSNKGYKPFLAAQVFGEESFMCGDIKVQPIVQNHGAINSSGFRFGDFAYSTDVHSIDERQLLLLDGVKVWVVGCLRYFCAETHFGLESVVRYMERVKPEIVILTHMGHNMGYSELCSLLPPNIRPAYDGMVIKFCGSAL